MDKTHKNSQLVVEIITDIFVVVTNLSKLV